MNSTRPNTPQYPQLVLLKQTDQGDEKFTKNGIVQTAHVVIKNTPFMLQLGLLNNVLFNHVFNFNQFTLEAKLLYDTEGEKEVDFVKVKPLDFKTHLSERGEQCTMEARIKVLSSQHEDLFFRIKVIALDARTGQEFCPSLFVLSQPIKVISKPEKVIKSNSQKKRNFTDMLLETVQKLEKQQKEQQQQITKLFELQKQITTTKPQKKEEAPAPVPATVPSSTALPPAKEAKKCGEFTTKDNSCLDFEQAFKKLIDSYTSLPADEKSSKIRKVVRNLTPSDTEALNQLIDLVGSEGLQREPIDLPQADAGEHLCLPKNACDCKNCHYKDELLRIDDFYKDFLGAL